jgi:hypothetical protein
VSDELENTETQPAVSDAEEQLAIGEQDVVEEAALAEDARELESPTDDIEPEAPSEATAEPDAESEPEPGEPDETPVVDDTEAEADASTSESTEPEPAEPDAVEEIVAAPEEVPASVSWVPFSVYLGLWVVLAVATVVLLRTPAAAGGALWAPEYALSVYGGVALVALGPVLALIVWLFARSKAEPEHRTGLLTSALLRAAGATFIGVVLWLVALYVLDLYRAGFHV